MPPAPNPLAASQISLCPPGVTATSLVWPPQRGHSEVLTYTFQVGQAVDIRKEELTTSPKTELLDKAFSLPKDLSAGLYTNPPGGLVITVPTNIPPGTVYTVNVSFLDQSRTQVFCLDLTMPVK
ncbi:MAG: hypothetical protein JOZ04_08415 [Acidimicrobiia bacterium]|nr:hypothetical protein [Acidimicrobiia bacterium]